MKRSTFFHVITLEELKTNDCGHYFSETGNFPLMVLADSNEAGGSLIEDTPIGGCDCWIRVKIRYCLLMRISVLMEASSKDF